MASYGVNEVAHCRGALLRRARGTADSVPTNGGCTGLATVPKKSLNRPIYLLHRRGWLERVVLQNQRAKGGAVTVMQNEKPVHEIRLGAIKAAIWKNETQTGPRYSATLSRIYRDEKLKEWKRTESFGRDDLLVVAKVADLTHTWIHGQTREEQDRDRDERERDAPNSATTRRPGPR
jgi:hypothetical protein